MQAKPLKFGKKVMTMPGLGILIFSCMFLMMHTAPAFADKKEVQLHIKAEVGTISKIEVSNTTIIFDLSTLNPDDAPTVSANPAQIDVTHKTRAGSNSPVNLTVLAAGDIVSGADVIPVNNISWIATGGGFVGGVMDKVLPQKVGNWTGGGVRSGMLAFRMINRWEYPRGEYGATSLFILTTP